MQAAERLYSNLLLSAHARVCSMLECACLCYFKDTQSSNAFNKLITNFCEKLDKVEKYSRLFLQVLTIRVEMKTGERKGSRM